MNKAYARKIKNGLISLIIKRAWPVWAIPFVIYATVAIPCLVNLWIPEPWTPDFHLRVSGFALQLLFVAIVVWDLFELRKDFDLPEPMAVMKQWFKDLIGIFRSKKVNLSGSSLTHSQVLGQARVKPSLGQTDKELIERIEILEERLQLFEDEMHEEIQEIKTDFRNLERSLNDEMAKRRQEIKSVRKFIKRISTRGFKRELVGLAWLVVGLPLSIFPGELAFILNTL